MTLGDFISATGFLLSILLLAFCVNMRLSFTGKAAFAVFISSAAALQLPGLSSLLKREDIEPGSPLYNCHAACGQS